MGRNLLILSATLLLFSIVSCGMQWSAGTHSSGGGALPGDSVLWQTTALVLFVASLVAAMAGTMAMMYEQVKRRDAERAERERRYGR
jgi:branched-subunit amino acid ABC-type transport system permease component